jgi:hypothetical protein
MALDTDWRAQWDAHKDLFVASNWLECAQDRQLKWPLPATFKYFSGGDMKLRTGIIVKTRQDQEEEFLKAGLLWAAQLANGARTMMYFVAPQFSESFLKLMENFGGQIKCKALYWRERMTPSLFGATGGGVPAQVKIEGSDWKTWGRQINPVEASYLKVLQTYFEGLSDTGARIVFKKNKIALCRGILEVAQIKKAGGKLDFQTTAKWLGRAAGEIYQKAGWVDAERCLNAAFRTATEDLLRLISDQAREDKLDAKETMSLLMWENPAQAGELWGRCADLPCVSVDGKVLDFGKIYFMVQEGSDGVQDLNVVLPVLDKPLSRIGTAVWWSGIMETVMAYLPQYRWDGRINCLVASGCQEELRIALEWLRDRESFPCFILDRQWKTNRALEFKPVSY